MKKIIKDQITRASCAKEVIAAIQQAWILERTSKDTIATLSAKVLCYKEVVHPVFKDNAEITAAFFTVPEQEDDWIDTMLKDTAFQVEQLKELLPFRSVIIQSVAEDCRIVKGSDEGALLKILEGSYISQEFIQSEIAKMFLTKGYTMNYDEVRKMQKNFSLHTYNALSEDEFTMRALPGDTRWTTFRCLYEPEDVACPTWDKALERMDNPDTFLAYIYGIYSGEYKGRQTMYWKGPPEIWKSIILKCITDNLLGDNMTATLDQTGAQRNQFFSSQFQGKEFLVVPDTKQTGYFLRGEFLSLSSGGHDKMTIESKYKTAVSQQVKLNIIITSNEMFRLNRSVQLTSRVLPVFSHGGKMTEDNLVEKLTQELPGFLAKGKIAFKEKYDTAGLNLTLSSVDLRLQEQMIGHHYKIIQRFVNEQMEITNDPEDSIPLKKVRRMYDTFTLKDSLSFQELVKEITEVHQGVNDEQDSDGVLSLTGIRLKQKKRGETI